MIAVNGIPDVLTTPDSWALSRELKRLDLRGDATANLCMGKPYHVEELRHEMETLTAKSTNPAAIDAARQVLWALKQAAH